MSRALNTASPPRRRLLAALDLVFVLYRRASKETSTAYIFICIPLGILIGGILRSIAELQGTVSPIVGQGRLVTLLAVAPAIGAIILMAFRPAQMRAVVAWYEARRPRPSYAPGFLLWLALVMGLSGMAFVVPGVWVFPAQLVLLAVLGILVSVPGVIVD